MDEPELAPTGGCVAATEASVDASTNDLPRHGDHRRALIIERDPSLRAVVRQKLAEHGVDVVEDSGQRDVAELAAQVQPDIAVLELAGYTGTDRLLQLRSVTDVPVIALLDRIVDCVDALEQGADDYLEKPLAPRELVAKIRSALRRTVDRRPPPLMAFDGLIIDRSAGQIHLDGELIKMPRREFELLTFLAGTPDRTFSRSVLLEAVWHASSDWLGPDTVTEHIRRLRRRIEADPSCPRRLQTVRGIGYRFCSSV
jgi:DNA-binding response OmpR family regulator